MKKLVLMLIRFYQKFISPENFGIYPCRFDPSCSKYTYKAVEKYGAGKGIVLGIYRIMRCNPFNKGGYDPVK